MIYTFQLHRTVHNMSKKQIQTHLPALAKRMLYSNKFPRQKENFKGQTKCWSKMTIPRATNLLYSPL